MPRSGRPTAEPKRNWTCFRLSDTDIQRIKYCAEKAGITKAEAARRGIENFITNYQHIQKIKRFERDICMCFFIGR